MTNQTPTDALRLVPCPFCGGEAERFEMADRAGVRCADIMCAGSHRLPSHGEDYVAAWNRRAAPASPLLEGGGQCSGISGELSGWQDISTAPKDGTRFHVWADGYEWPETVLWELYDEETAEEIGEVGYWTYAETLMSDAADDCGQDDWTHWRPLPDAPTGAK